MAGQYLISKFADQLGVIVVCFDDLCFATGQMRGALDEVRPQGSLGQKDLVWIQVHLSDHFVGHLRNNAVQHLQQFKNGLKTEKLTLDMNQNKNTIYRLKKKETCTDFDKGVSDDFSFLLGVGGHVQSLADAFAWRPVLLRNGKCCCSIVEGVSCVHHCRVT